MNHSLLPVVVALVVSFAVTGAAAAPVGEGPRAPLPHVARNPSPPSAIAVSRTVLLRVERRADEDLAALLALDAHVVLETNTALFVEGEPADAPRLGALGWTARVVDEGVQEADYVHVGLRPDTDRAVVEQAGAVVDAGENWMIVRVPRGQQREVLPRLGAARAFAAPVGHDALMARAATRAAPTERAGAATGAATRAAPTERAGGKDPLVQKVVDGVRAERVEEYWIGLTTNPPSGTRYSPSQGARDSAEYCKQQMDAVGVPAELQAWDPGHAPNAVGTHRGALTPGQVYIVIGHLDDLPSSGPAPGADDNASGSVNVLESARVLGCYGFRSTIKFIACTGEEQGLLGSDAYARDAYARGEDIRGVVNMDMIAWEGDGLPNPENLDVNYNAASEGLGRLFAQAAVDYGTGLAVDAFLCPSLTASDHQSFWRRGWPAICGITDNEGYCGHGGNYPDYHTSADTIDNCGDRALFLGTIKTTVATIATLAGPFRITFDRAALACSGEAQVIVADRDLDTDPARAETVAVEVWSTGEPTPEVLVLTEDGPHSLYFRGTLRTHAGAPVAGDGQLAVAPGDTVSARYVDALDCDGTPAVASIATAVTDCTAPVITNVHETAVGIDRATIAWTTDEPADGEVAWGPAVPPANTTAESAVGTAHAVPLTGLAACTVYHYGVRSSDPAGNAAASDDGGTWFHFETLGDFGAGPQPCHDGRVTLQPATVGCTATLDVELVDMDLNASGTTADRVEVELTSSTEALPERLVLVETGANTSTFRASFAVAPGAPVPGDGVVQARDGNVVTVTYRDADDGTGSAGLSFATARVDCGAPVVDRVEVVQITDESAAVRVTTAEPTTVRVSWGPTPDLGREVEDATLATSHQLTLSPLNECGRAWFRVTATDAYGNVRVLGAPEGPFAFNAGIIPGLWRDGFESTSGWTLNGEWQVGGPQGKGTAPGDPAAAFAGTGVLGEDLTGTGTYRGDYELRVDERAVSPVINASALTGGRLAFRRWLNVGGGAISYVEVRDGAVWRTVWMSHSVTGVSDTAWSLQTVDISAYADRNPNLQIAFRTKAGPGSASNRAGWNVDRVVVRSAGQPEYVACGGCGGAPSFGGVVEVRDVDPCAASGVEVRWSAAAAWGTGGGGTYAVYRSSDPAFVPAAANRVAAGVAGTAWIDAGAPEGVTSYYVVRAENDETCGSGPANGGVTDGNVVRVAVTPSSAWPPAGSVDALRVGVLGGAHVRLAWPAAANAVGYRVKRADEPAPASGFGVLGETDALRWDDLGEAATAARWFYLVDAENGCTALP